MLIQLTKEDGFYENAGAILFLLTAIAFSLLAAKRNHYQCKNRTGRYVERLYFLLFALLFVFAFGEEVSWRQRIFNYSTPEVIAGLNRQEEFHLHKIEIFRRATSEGVENTGLLRLITMTRLFYIAFLTYLLIIPIICKMNGRFREFINKIKLPVPPIIFGLLFGFNIVFAKLVVRYYDNAYQGITEIKETVFALILVVLPISWMNTKSVEISLGFKKN